MENKSDKKFKIALAGHPNSGKTTIFNLLAGAKEKIGNWSGTTVEKKVGKFFLSNNEIELVDLPGIYGLSAYSIDERIARDFLIEEDPDLVVSVIDATNLERNLFLPIQILEMGKPLIIVFNMMDMVEKQNIKINIDEISKVLNVDIVPTVALHNKGINDLKNTIVKNISEKKEVNFKIDYKHNIEDAIFEIIPVLKKREKFLGLPERFIALKVLEDDIEMIEKLKNTNIYEETLKIKEKYNKKLEDVETEIIERRYGFIHGLLSECMKKEPTFEEKLDFSDKLDTILTNKYIGIPLFLIFMFLLFEFVFVVGNPLAGLVGQFFVLLSNITKSLCLSLHFSNYLISFLTDGIISGIGSVLVFLPNILLLFLGISILEDSGYMARAAFVMDRFMHFLGLHGKSFIPMIIGFGCNIPGIMATRTLTSRKDRILTILILPLMSCSARLPVYVLFSSVFFAKYQGLIVFSLYFIGIILAIIVAKFFKHIFFKSEVAPLIMELPPYRLPTLKNALITMWERSRIFVKKAGTIIFFAVVLIWLLSSLPFGVKYASEQSLIGVLGKFIAPVFKPAGFGFWQAAVALIFGIMAKEVVVGTLGTLFGGEGMLKVALAHYFTPLSAYAFLLMTLIYIPCIATIAVIKRETNWKWALLSVSYSLILGWVVSVLFYQIGSLF